MSYVDRRATIYRGHVLDALRAMPAESVHCGVSSPPYFGLRDYGLDPSAWGGDPGHVHRWGVRDARPGKFCACGAWLGCLGLEGTPGEFVAHLAEVFGEFWRVLRKDGTLWLNLGDSYAAGGRGTSGRYIRMCGEKTAQARNMPRVSAPAGYKAKDLLGMPWAVAFALRDAGWYLRADVVWSKPNPMPESIRDRPTKAHEYLFLLAKRERYFYDAEAVREPSTAAPRASGSPAALALEQRKGSGAGDEVSGRVAHRSAVAGGQDLRAEPTADRNLRSVWEIPTQPFAGAHFATMPEELARRCVLAGTSSAGCCPECGAPRARVVSATGGSFHDHGDDAEKGQSQGCGQRSRQYRENLGKGRQTTGWRSTCRHDASLDPAPPVVLDPFCGSGTTGVVSLDLGRRFVGVEAKPEYAEMARRRIASAAPLLTRVDVVDVEDARWPRK